MDSTEREVHVRWASNRSKRNEDYQGDWQHSGLDYTHTIEFCICLSLAEAEADWKRAAASGAREAIEVIIDPDCVWHLLSSTRVVCNLRPR